MGPDVAGSQGTIRVPLPVGRRPTDWERNVAGLEGARWATADMAYRRSALERVGGFDERFRRAYREDADLALRIIRAGFQLTRGSREVLHPVRPADGWASLRVQAGNADDALMAALHGREWPEAVGASRGRRPAHMATTVLAAAMISGVVTGQRWLAVAGGVGWLAATGDLAWRRIAPGPRTLREIVGMVATSAAMPPVATAYWLAGLVRGFWLTWGHRRESPPVRRRHVQNGVERQVA